MLIFQYVKLISLSCITQVQVYSHNLIECQHLMAPVLRPASKPIQLLSVVYCGNTIFQETAAYLVPVLLTKLCNGNWLKDISSVSEKVASNLPSTSRLYLE